MPRGVTHPREVIERALMMSGQGLSDYEVAVALGVPRSTIQRWRVFGTPQDRFSPRLLRPVDDPSYSYLLGLYLGDGHISGRPRTWALTISLDAVYPRIVSECRYAITEAIGRAPRTRYRKGTMLVIAHSVSLPDLFPQHGPGKKHKRPIWLADWQQQIAERYPRQLLRGLIHSDGSRCINRFSVKLPSGRVGRYAYPRYFFTNLSADIRGIFCEHCEMLGVRWTQSNARNISVSHRDSVAILDSFVGPKA